MPFVPAGWRDDITDMKAGHYTQREWGDDYNSMQSSHVNGKWATEARSIMGLRVAWTWTVRLGDAWMPMLRKCHDVCTDEQARG